jgi:hypothetical protein
LIKRIIRIVVIKYRLNLIIFMDWVRIRVFQERDGR